MCFRADVFYWSEDSVGCGRIDDFKAYTLGKVISVVLASFDVLF